MLQKPLPIRILHSASKLLLPGDYVKTFFYLNAIAKPRRFFQQYLYGFYRMDHIYEVLQEMKKSYQGSFSILEFGTGHGYAFTKMLYATKYLGVDNRVTVHGFDSFEGMPAPEEADQDLIVNDGWVKGQFSAQFEQLSEYCKRKEYKNYVLHKGYFENTLTDKFCESLKKNLPILIWIDCDYYSSARIVFERLMPYIPNGCVIYFDEYEMLNYGSRFSGEAKLVAEVNSGLFGKDVELVLDRQLSLNTNRCYRFVRLNPTVQYVPLGQRHSGDQIRKPVSDSPLP